MIGSLYYNNYGNYIVYESSGVYSIKLLYLGFFFCGGGEGS